MLNIIVRKQKIIYQNVDFSIDNIKQMLYNNNCQEASETQNLLKNERKVSSMCQPTTTITAKVEELMNLKKLAEELQNQMEAITDEIKAFMGDEETMMAGSYKVTWKETVSRRVDTAALKKVLGDALDEYTKTITTRPFKVI